MFTECVFIGMYSTAVMTSLYISEYLRARDFAIDRELICVQIKKEA